MNYPSLDHVRKYLTNRNISFRDSRDKLVFDRKICHVLIHLEVQMTNWGRPRLVRFVAPLFFGHMSFHDKHLGYFSDIELIRTLFSYEFWAWRTKKLEDILTLDFQRFVCNLDPSLIHRIPSHCLDSVIKEEFFGHYSLGEIGL